MTIRHLVLSLTLSFTLQAQLYVHDPNRDAAAQNAKKKFAEATDKDSGVYAAMLANLDSVHQRNLATAKELNDATASAFLNRLPAMTWDLLEKDLLKVQDQFKGLMTESLSRLEQLEEAMNGSKGEKADFAKKLRDLEKTLADKKKEFSAARPTLKQFEDEIDKVKSSGSKLDTAPLKSLIQSASALKELNRLFNSLGDQPPGLKLVILDLGVSLQRVELDREQANLIHYENQLRLENARVRDLERVVGSGIFKDGSFSGPGFGTLLSAIRADASGKNSFCASTNDPIMVTLSKLAFYGSKDLTLTPQLPALDCPKSTSIPEALQYTLRLRNLVDALAQISAMNGFESFLKNAAALERVYEDQRHAIRISQINARGRETLISHGLDGLGQFYSGGWKPEDTANLFRALQAAATSAIGARL